MKRYLTALFTNMRIVKFKSQLTIAVFAAVNHLNGPPRKQRALSIYEKNPEISVVAKVEFPIGKKLFHLVVNPGTWRGARPWTWNWYKLRET